jgi:hypothetical protein
VREALVIDGEQRLATWEMTRSTLGRYFLQSSRSWGWGGPRSAGCPHDRVVPGQSQVRPSLAVVHRERSGQSVQAAPKVTW